jgi:hypothetical protein
MSKLRRTEKIMRAWDNVHGGVLPPKLVAAARGEEVGYMHKMEIWSVVPTTQCWGKAPTQ